MNNLRLLTACFFCFVLTSLFAQSGNLQFKLTCQPDQRTWVVSVLADDSLSPDNRTQTGSGQVTIVTPVNFTYDNFTNLGGTWEENARVNAPLEASLSAYLSFGFVVEVPKIRLFPQQETALFSFTADPEFAGSVRLIDNFDDPFLPPNSHNSNPGNDLGVIDFSGANGLAYLTYGSNYNASNGRAILVKNKVQTGAAKAVFTSLE